LSEKSEDGTLQPRKQSLLRSSAVMASGTMVSRILGFIRNAMLIAAIGSVGPVGASFTAANTLPNTVYNVLAAGILDAILVPQIIRALRRKGGDTYLNRLITLAGTLLFGITFLTMVGAPLLVSLFSNQLEGSTRILAVTFSLWCLPQLFFYGVYNLLGEVLNARGHFGPFMWAPVVNNVVGIAGLAAFLFLWGPTSNALPAEDFTGTQILVIAGSATLGVILQAACLIIPVKNSGVKLRLDFHFKGTDFGSASKVASWTFATLAVSQLGVLTTTNITAAAANHMVETGEPVANAMAYSTAFMIYMVPQSLIAVTLATAIFTRLANNVASANFKEVAQDYHTGVQLIVMLSMLAMAALAAGAIPMMQMIMPGGGEEDAVLYSQVLLALILGIPSTGIVMISQRVFFAFEDAKPVFLMGIVPTGIQLVVAWSIFFIADAHWWTIGASAAETACRVVQGFIAVFWTAHRVRAINPGKIIAQYLLYLMAAAISAGAAWFALRPLSPYTSGSSSLVSFLGATGKLFYVGIIVVAVFLAVLRLLDPNGFASAKNMVLARFGKGTVPEPHDDEPEARTSQIDLSAIAGSGLNPSGSGLAVPPPRWDDIIVPGSNAFMTAAPRRPQWAAPPSTSSRQSGGSTPKPVHSNGAPVKVGQSTPDSGYDSNATQEANQGGKVAKPQQVGKRDLRFNPTKWSIALATIAVGVGGFYAWTTLSEPIDDSLFSSLPGGDAPESTEPPIFEETPTPTPTPVAPGAPIITGVEVFSQANDGLDHPELAGALTDGDPNSLWYSRYYDWNEFAEDNTIALLVSFSEKSRATEIVLDFVGGSGDGEIAVKVPEDGNPRAGKVLVTAPVTEHTVIKLPKDTDVSALGINFVKLPLDDEGIPRAKVTSLTIK